MDSISRMAGPTLWVPISPSVQVGRLMACRQGAPKALEVDQQLNAFKAVRVLA
jgi:hypothetical protein